MLKSTISSAATAIIAITAGTSWAQDAQLTPGYGAISLSAGFAPDPHVVQMDAGGSISEPCGGLIESAPSLSLNYAQTSNQDLVIEASSSADTTLLVFAPDMTWYCDDNGGPLDANPRLVFEGAGGGSYYIWVGAKGGSGSASLSISNGE